jgi:hypothetical protein
MAGTYLETVQVNSFKELHELYPSKRLLWNNKPIEHLPNLPPTESQLTLIHDCVFAFIQKIKRFQYKNYQCFAFHPKDPCMLVVSDSKLVLYQLPSLKIKLIHDLDGLGEKIHIVQIHFSNDGQYVFIHTNRNSCTVGVIYSFPGFHKLKKIIYPEYTHTWWEWCTNREGANVLTNCILFYICIGSTVIIKYGRVQLMNPTKPQVSMTRDCCDCIIDQNNIHIEFDFQGYKKQYYNDESQIDATNQFAVCASQSPKPLPLLLFNIQTREYSKTHKLFRSTRKLVFHTTKRYFILGHTGSWTLYSY